MKPQIANLIALLHNLEADFALSFDPACHALTDAFAAGKKLLVCGNGGSAAMAAHMAAEFVVRFDVDRRALPAIALTEPTILTAGGNDYGYNRTLSRQVEAYGISGDVLVAYSTSGRSKNVLDAVAEAKKRGMVSIGISGNAGMGACDIDICVKSNNTARIQEAHLVITHLLVQTVLERVPQ